MWLYRPRDLHDVLDDLNHTLAWNELFLSLGRQEQITPYQRLENIQGFLNVSCTLNDPRNRFQPTQHQLEKAGFFYPMGFDGSCRVFIQNYPNRIQDYPFARFFRSRPLRTITEPEARATATKASEPEAGETATKVG